MPKQKLFDEDSADEVTFKTENEYAKKYDSWREKEELHKLEQKYGDKVLSSDILMSSDSEDESDGPPEVSEEMERQFLKTLALLKTKDPRIYNPSFKFFESAETKEPEKEPKTKTLTFADSDDDDDEDDGKIFTIEKKALELDTTEDKPENNINHISEEGKLKDYLTGKSEHIDNAVEQELAPLKALWSDPNLNEGEAFLRDYILNKKYLDEGDVGETLDKVRDDDDLEADEKMVEEQGKFERAYNFRFEEPDQEYLKRFPRTMNYTRPKDDRRSRKRAEAKTRKEEEKKKKMEEIARLKALKLKELQEKMAKIKEVTGNEDLAFTEEDVEGEWEPAQHDRRMAALFDQHYYARPDARRPPACPALDLELEIEHWENYEPEGGESHPAPHDAPHCEDPDFNMDADYDPNEARTNLVEEIKRNLGNKRRNRKKKSKLAELLSGERPTYVPGDLPYAHFMEQYYGMDCEDVIAGDLPTRFKYRQVLPNDFGLSVEEILLADDKELTQWVPLKKIVKYRPQHVEKGDLNTYAAKAADINLKKKILPSLFKDLPEEPEVIIPEQKVNKKKKKKKKDKSKQHNAENVADESGHSVHENGEHNNTQNAEEQVLDNNEEPTSCHIKGNRNKKKYKAQDEYIEDTTENVAEGNIKIELSSTKVGVEDNVIKKKKKSKHNSNNFTVEDITAAQPSQLGGPPPHRAAKRELGGLPDCNEPCAKKTKLQNIKHKNNFKSKFNQNRHSDKLENISDNRLKAYGLNPKKYRNFLKYKNF